MTQIIPTAPTKHPKANDKINYVIDFFMDMCDAPFSVYLTTLWPALMEALITYYALDPVQIFTRWVKPPGIYKGFRGGNHRRGNGRRSGSRTWRRFWQTFTGFDPNNVVGDAIQVDDGLAPRSITPGVRTLWHLYDVEQRVMYWIMLYEITEQFFYRWSSGVANSMYCKQQYRPLCFAASSTDGNAGVAPKTPVVIETVVKARHVAFVGGNGIRVEGRGSSCVFSAKFVGEGGNPDPQPGQRLIIMSDDGIFLESADFPGPHSTVSVSGAAQGEVMWTFWTTGPGNYLIEDLEMTVIGFEGFFGG